VTAQRIGTDAEAIAAAAALAAEFARGAQARDRNRHLPHAEVARMAKAGLWAVTVPRRFGGAGVSAGTLAEVIAILSAADGSIGQIPQNHCYILEALRLDGSEAQQRDWYGRVLEGARIGNALSEAGTRSHTDFKTTLLPDGDGSFRLHGRKFYCTGTLFADFIAAVAKDEAGRRVIALVPQDAPGVTLIDDWSGFGQRTTGSGTVVFDSVRVPAEAVVEHHRAFSRPTPMGPLAQIMHAAIDLGLGRAAIAAARKPTEDAALIQQAGELFIRLRAAEAMIARAALIVDAATREPKVESVAAASVAVAEAKVLTTELAISAGNAVFDFTGVQGTDDSLGLDRLWRDARTHTLHDPLRWKLHAIGNWTLNGVAPPRHGAI
jgi:SfnB family sulfur acquisition oxidoreductase